MAGPQTVLNHHLLLIMPANFPSQTKEVSFAYVVLFLVVAIVGWILSRKRDQIWDLSKKKKKKVMEGERTLVNFFSSPFFYTLMAEALISNRISAIVAPRHPKTLSPVVRIVFRLPLTLLLAHYTFIFAITIISSRQGIKSQDSLGKVFADGGLPPLTTSSRHSPPFLDLYVNFEWKKEKR